MRNHDLRAVSDNVYDSIRKLYAAKIDEEHSMAAEYIILKLYSIGRRIDDLIVDVEGGKRVDRKE